MLFASPHLLGRSLTVWLLITGLAAGCWVGVGASVLSLTSPAPWSGTFEDLLVAIASAALLGSACWLWVITTLTVADLVVGRESLALNGVTRRLILTACGVAVIASVSSPALAGVVGSHEHSLAGLPLPDRAVTGTPAHDSPRQEGVTTPAREVRHPSRSASATNSPITVRGGDSLWSIAGADLGPQATQGEIDDRWRALYAANRDEIGGDPDLIMPGQNLRIPPLAPAPDTDR